MKDVEDHYWDKVNSIAISNNILFLGFIKSHTRKDKNKCKFFCKTHQHYWDTTNINNFLIRKTSPCKYCSKERVVAKLSVSEEQYLPLVLTACEHYNTEFIGWVGDFKGVTSVITHRCKIHKIITPKTHARVLVEGKNITSGCKACHQIQFKKSIKGNTDLHIKQFMATDKYVDGTTFSRNLHKVTKAGVFNYWDVYCPTCNEYNTSFIGSLKSGKLPCSCSRLINRMGFYPSRHDWEDTLYLLEYDTSEGLWYKIGRSFCLDRRLGNLRSIYKTINIISTVSSDHTTVFDTEQYLHQLNMLSTYKPKIPFGGAGECYLPEILNHPEIISTFNL